MRRELLTDEERAFFESARMRVLSDSYADEGIGSYSERSLHKIVKLFLEPDEEYHEIKYLGSVADVLRGDEILEIQTRALGRLRPKLDKFLKEKRVTVVFPIASETRIFWLDKETGEMSPPRKSPKRCGIYDAVFELYNIRDYISNPRFSLKLIFLSVDEFRYRGARVLGKERRKMRIERIPTSISEIIDLNSPEDYKIFFPEGIGDEFCAADLERAVGHGFSHGYSLVRLLRSSSLIDDGVKMGRRIVYTKQKP